MVIKIPNGIYKMTEKRKIVKKNVSLYRNANKKMKLVKVIKKRKREKSGSDIDIDLGGIIQYDYYTLFYFTFYSYFGNILF